jgi:hypothetical protein
MKKKEIKGLNYSSLSKSGCEISSANYVQFEQTTIYHQGVTKKNQQ